MFRRLTAVKGDALPVFPHPRHGVAKVRFVALLIVIEPNETAAYQVRQPGSQS